MELTRRNKISLIILGFVFFALMLVGYRIYETESTKYVFLIWNLFLAFIPFAITNWLNALNPVKHRWYHFLAWGVWFIFFPNAPYILTDLFHLRYTHDFPIWYDLILILTFAWVGLFMAMISLHDFQKFLAKAFGTATSWIGIVLMTGLSAFGVYLGRYLRWNSWDILSDPFGLVSDISDRFIHPLNHPRTWGMTIGLFVFLFMSYLLLRVLLDYQSDKSVMSAELGGQFED